MHFTGEITLGNIVIVVTLIGIAIRFGIRVGIMETTLKMHADTMVQHSIRLDKYEGRLVEITGNVQRLVGRVEATQDRLERKTGGRYGEGGGL